MAKRVSKQTKKFGAVSNMEFSSDEEEPFDGDNSFEDKDFSPEKRPNRMSFSSEDNRNKINFLDFNSEFEKIDSVNCQRNINIHVPHEETQNAVDVRPKSIDHNVDSPSFQSEVLSQLEKLTNYSKEILLRYAVIEESLIKSGLMASVKFKSKIHDHDEFNSYIKAKKMPFTTIESFKSFDLSLDEKSMEQAVSIYALVML